MRYEAFLSYARVPDLALATALERDLQAFAKPWNRLRAIDVFRDQSNLASIGGLGRSITGAIDASGFLILLACPESARSHWVRHEVEHWLATKSTATIVLVLTGGSAYWNRETEDFDWQKTDALPDCLRGRYAEEPLWLDARWTAGVDKLSVRDARFHDAVAEISAIVRGVPKEQLVGEDVRQHRKLRTLQRAAVAALAVLAVAAAVAAVAALQQRNRAVANAARAETASKLALANQALAETNASRALANEREAVRQQAIAEERRVVAEKERAEAERQRELAVLQRNRAESRGLASASLSTGGDTQLALNLAVEAVKIAATEESRRALRRALVSSRALDPNGVADLFWEGSRTDAGEPIGEIIKPFFARSRTGNTLASPDGARTVAVDGCCVLVVRERIDDTVRTLTLTGHSDSIEAIAFDPTGRFIVSGAQDQTVRVWNALTGQQLDVFPHDGQVVQVAFSANGAAIVAHSRRTRRAWESYLGRPATSIEMSRRSDDHIRAIKLNDVVLSPRRDVAAVWGWHGIVVMPTGSSGAHWALDGMAPVFSPDNRELAVTDAAGVSVYDLATRKPRVRLRVGSGRQSAAYSADGSLIATTSTNGPIDLWDVATGARRATLPSRERATLVAFDRSGRQLVAVSKDGTATLWSLGDGTPTWTLRGTTAIAGAWFGPDDRWVALVPASGATRLIDGATGRDLSAFSHRDGYQAQTGALNATRTWLALGSDYTYAPSALGYRAPVTLWNLMSLAPKMLPERTLVGHSQAITSIDFSPDGRWLVTGGLDNAVLVWDLSDGQIVDSSHYSSAGVFRAVFAGDGRHVVVADRDGRVSLHDCVPCGDDTALLAVARAKIVTPLSEDQRRRYLPGTTGERGPSR